MTKKPDEWRFESNPGSDRSFFDRMILNSGIFAEGGVVGSGDTWTTANPPGLGETVNVEKLRQMMREWDFAAQPRAQGNEIRVWSLEGFALSLEASLPGLIQHHMKSGDALFGVPVVLDRSLPEGVIELRNANGDTRRIMGVPI